MASRLAIRKSFEIALKATLDAYTPAVAVNWPNGNQFDPAKLTQVLTAEPSLHMAPETPRTMGSAPAIQFSGHFLVMLGLKSGQPQDLLDALADAVNATFPYGVELMVSGERLRIVSKTVGATPVTVEGWDRLPVDIQWSIDI